MDVRQYQRSFAHPPTQTRATVLALALLVTVSLVMPQPTLADHRAAAEEGVGQTRLSQAMHQFALLEGQDRETAPAKAKPTCVIYDELSRRARVDAECKAAAKGQDREEESAE